MAKLHFQHHFSSLQMSKWCFRNYCNMMIWFSINLYYY